MAIGILTVAASGIEYVAASSSTGLDLFVALNSPVAPIVYSFFIPSGVVISNAVLSTPSISAVGFHPDTQGFWVNQGRVVGSGGNGGWGAKSSAQPLIGGGAGGGGGAGYPPGIGGDSGRSGGLAGSDGTDASTGSPPHVGGAGSVDGTVIGSTTDIFVSTGAMDGSDAVEVDHQITIDNGAGEFWGGGGGGASGYWRSTTGKDGGTGGAVGQPGEYGLTLTGPVGTNLTSFGEAGYAIRLVAGTPSVVFKSGSGDPNIKGTVG